MEQETQRPVVRQSIEEHCRIHKDRFTQKSQISLLTLALHEALEMLDKYPLSDEDRANKIILWSILGPLP